MLSKGKLLHEKKEADADNGKKIERNEGYTGYRGRRRGRGVLAVVLVVILLLACGFLFAQRYMVYDADGSVRFEFPWIKKTPQDDTANGGDSGDDKKQDDLEITVQKPVIKDTYAVELGADALGSDWQAALDGLDKDVNAWRSSSRTRAARSITALR